MKAGTFGQSWCNGERVCGGARKGKGKRRLMTMGPGIQESPKLTVSMAEYTPLTLVAINPFFLRLCLVVDMKMKKECGNELMN
ncbi:hypothetical protein VNO78_07701 [Psophocarpus tetragonolobus]|uniref:Uncharacterized protein n=1 Tax=Psophocarpus tetragonolobus TaxID=3891 RepID=A0AAN9STI5_PSOTE